MSIKEVNDLISLMACVSCSEIDGSMCENYSHQTNEFLKEYPEEVKQHFLECWIAVSRCASIHSKPFEKLQSNCDTLRKRIIPEYLKSEVKQYKGNAANSSNPSEYLANCIADWVDAAVSNPDMTY